MKINKYFDEVRKNSTSPTATNNSNTSPAGKKAAFSVAKPASSTKVGCCTVCKT